MVQNCNDKDWTTVCNRDWTMTWTTAAKAIHGAVSYTDKKHLSLVDVMGLTGHAFRMNIDKKQVDITGPTAFPYSYVLRRNLCNLGFIGSVAEASVPVDPEILQRTMAVIQQSIDQGVPAISWDLFIPEFGLIYGYDDDKQVFHAKDVTQDGTLTYAQFTEPKIGFVFAMTLSESLPHSKYEMLRMALDTIVEHAHGTEWNADVFKDDFAVGLAGYDAWISVMEQRKADELGNSYNTAVAADAREFAVQFLKELASRWDGTNIVERTVRQEASEAVKYYAVVAEAFHELNEMFPFPQGGEPKNPETADRAIALLRKAQEAETKGVAVLEKLLSFMKAYHAETCIY